jgi:hypothetical protein
MIIVSDLFNYDGDTRYEKMAKVLEYSAKKYSPNIEFRMIKHPAPKEIRGKTCFASNNLKLQKWVEMLDNINDDVMLLDCDMAILRDVSDAFEDKSFDIGITYLCDDRERLPFNGGTILVRNTDAAKAFMRKWLEIDNRMYNSDSALHAKYRDKYAGMNQASLGMLLEHTEMQAGAIIKRIDCHEWNWCRDRWKIPDTGKGPRILHIKSQTRKNVFLPTAIELLDIKVRKAVQIWRKLADEAGAQKFPNEALNATMIKREGAYVFNSKPKQALQFRREI